MAKTCKTLAILAVFGVVLLYFYVINTQTPVVPKLEDVWWGPGSPKKDDVTIKPFKINIPDEVIRDLHVRLNRTLPFQAPLEHARQHYGINTNLLKTIIEYWKTKYDWKKRQEFLNQFPQYQTEIQGLKIHFLHVKPQKRPQGVEVVPLLLLHGWPGSVREFYEILPILTTPQPGRNFVFEVVAPSLPGYGFSDATSKQGLGTETMAKIFDNLMKRLKFGTYYVQGGDWGSIIASDIAAFFPDHVKAVHMNMCFINTPITHIKILLGSFWPSLIADDSEIEVIYPLSKQYSYTALESGYLHLQSTKPDTIGVALKDSPVGLAAYIIEKFTTWTNPGWKDWDDGGLTQKFTFDQLLDNVMIYWTTSSITTSMRIYSEHFNKARANSGIDYLPVTVPAGCSRFRYEVVYTPKSILKDKFQKLIDVVEHDDGGHFAAFELPEVLDGEVDLSMSDLDEVPVKEIAALKKTLSLDLSNNRLAFLPSNFIVLTTLTKLDLSKNELAELPEDFGSLSKLKYLDLYRNKLQHLPLSFSRLTSLKFLDLKDNPLVPAVGKIAGPCIDTKGCQQCAKDIVSFYKKLQEEVDDEVEMRNKARQKQMELNRQKKQEEKKKFKIEKQKEKKGHLEQAGRNNLRKANKKELKKVKNSQKKKQDSSLFPKLFMYIFLPALIVVWILTSLQHPLTDPLTNSISNCFSLLLSKLPPSCKAYGEMCQHFVKLSKDYTKTLIENTLDFLNTNEFLQDLVKKGNDSYIKLLQTMRGSK